MQHETEETWCNSNSVVHPIYITIELATHWQPHSYQKAKDTVLPEHLSFDRHYFDFMIQLKFHIHT